MVLISLDSLLTWYDIYAAPLQIKNTRHPSAPKAVRLPTHGRVREVNSTDAPELSAVGEEKHGSARLRCYSFSSSLCRHGKGCGVFVCIFELEILKPRIRDTGVSPSAYSLRAYVQFTGNDGVAAKGLDQAVGVDCFGGHGISVIQITA